MPTIQAQDVVNAVIQDSQSKTTNRTALYDYVDRIHQRILRESKWRFLLSDPVYFTTMPGVASYTLSGTAPAGSFQTNLNLTNFNNIAPGTVFNTSGWAKIEEDSDDAAMGSILTNRDGSLRTGTPRTYSNSMTSPGTITLKPTPDGENLYYPIPETPIVTSQAVIGCTLPTRTYWGVVTLVDNLGGESVQCTIPFTIAVPAGNVLTVQSPLGVPGAVSGNQAQYSFWNLYIGNAFNAYWIQNPTPLGLGANWTENSTTGIYKGTFALPSVVNTPTNSVLQISSVGMLSATTTAIPVFAVPYALIDSNNGWWEVLVSGGSVTTTSITPGPGVIGHNAIFLADISGTFTWKVQVGTNGLLNATAIGPPTSSLFYQLPPNSPTIQPLNAYVIQLRYYQSRNQIANPTDVLQVPYAYKDIVIAGVNYLASLYIDERENREPAARTLVWKRDFDTGLAQIRRDLRVNYRKVDFIGPDRASQTVATNQQGIPTQGW